MESESGVLDVAKNLARIGAGFKDGPWFKSPNLAPAMNITGQGYPDTVEQKLQYTPTEAPTPTDPWFDRRK